MINNRAVRDFFKIFKVHLMVDWFFRAFPREKQIGLYKYPVEILEALLSKNGFVIKKENKEDSETALVFAERK